jgi:hypothetical protein
VLGRDGATLALEVAAVDSVGERAAALVAEHGVGLIALGNSTGHAAVAASIAESCAGVTIRLTDESFTTEEARREFWRANPPQGVWRLVPTSLRVPPVPVDAYAALALARRAAADEQHPDAAP